MRMLSMSLKRLYANQKVTKEKLEELVERETITPEEYEQITGEEYAK